MAAPVVLATQQVLSGEALPLSASQVAQICWPLPIGFFLTTVVELGVLAEPLSRPAHWLCPLSSGSQAFAHSLKGNFASNLERLIKYCAFCKFAICIEKCVSYVGV